MLFRPVRFCTNFVVFTVLAALLAYLAEAVFQMDLGAGAASVPLLVAAMNEGSHVVRISGQRPNSAAMWRAAFQMAWLSVLLSFLFLVGLILTFPELLALFAQITFPIWIALVALIAVLNLLAVRVGFWVGVRTTVRQLQ